MCGGDCNLNGLVLGTEISTLMCQMGGACSDDACVTGDIDEDGQVTGNDVARAVRNLGFGCPGEGVPLVYQPLRIGETRTIEIGSAMGFPGEIVDIVVGLEGGGEVSTFQTDILFDTRLVEIEVVVTADGAILPQCDLDPRLQGTFYAQARLPQLPISMEGLRRLRLAVVDIELPFPLDSFEAGPVFSCRFRIDPSVEGNTSIPLMGDLGRAEVGDFNGGTFTSSVSDGSISVADRSGELCEFGGYYCPRGLECVDGQCVPLLGTCYTCEDCLPRQACFEDSEISVPSRCECECVGDCNFDGRVRGNEITAMINIINGVADPTTCLAADRDGDGRVRANEITLAILNINQGCPGQFPTPAATPTAPATGTTATPTATAIGTTAMPTATVTQILFGR